METTLKTDKQVLNEICTALGLQARTDPTDMPTNDLEALDWINKAVDRRLIYVAEVDDKKGTWYYWDGTRYAPTKEDVSASHAKDLAACFKEVIRVTRRDNPDIGKDDPIAKTLEGLTSNYRYFSSATGMRNLDFVLRRNPADPAVFENDSDFIVMDNGQVLNTSDLYAQALPPSRERLVSRKLGVSLDGQEDIPVQFLAALAEWGISPEEIRYLQQSAGCAILGKGGAKNIPTLLGISNTAKSAYISIMTKVFGGYAGKLAQGALLDRGVNFEQHTARGKRFVYVEEPKTTGKMDDAFLKAYANGFEHSEQETQRKGRDLETWPVQGVIHIVTNKMPKMDFQDDAIVGRIDVVEFTKVYPPTAPGTDREFADKIFAAEGPAILRWILQGAQDYIDRGKIIYKPESISNRALSNVSDSSVTLQWLTSRFESGEWAPDTTAPHSTMVQATTHLYTIDFNVWCSENGIQQRDVPTRKVWLEEMSRYMKEPANMVGKRPQGTRRIWGVVKVQNSNTKNAPLTSSPFQVEGTHARFR